jgi:hypothetical protein
MPQSNLQSIEERSRSLLEFLLEHEEEVKQLFSNRDLLQTVADPFNITVERNVTLTNQVDEKIYTDFKDFCKNKRLKVKAALMRAMLDLMVNYRDFNQD